MAIFESYRGLFHRADFSPISTDMVLVDGEYVEGRDMNRDARSYFYAHWDDGFRSQYEGTWEKAFEMQKRNVGIHTSGPHNVDEFFKEQYDFGNKNGGKNKSGGRF